MSFALPRKSGESPSAPPITKIVLATRLVPPLAEPAGKRGTVDILAALVEATSTEFSGIAADIAAAFFGDSRGRVARAAFGDFMNVEAAKAELAAGIVEALGIALGQLALGPLLQPADGNDDDSHRSVR